MLGVVIFMVRLAMMVSRFSGECLQGGSGGCGGKWSVSMAPETSDGHPLGSSES